MTNKQVFEQFVNMFQNLSAEKVEIWFPNGKNSIRIRTVSKREFIFTYNGSDDWILETTNNFLKRR